MRKIDRWCERWCLALDKSGRKNFNFHSSKKVYFLISQLTPLEQTWFDTWKIERSQIASKCVCVCLRERELRVRMWVQVRVWEGERERERESKKGWIILFWYIPFNDWMLSRRTSCWMDNCVNMIIINVSYHTTRPSTILIIHCARERHWQNYLLFD
jgi:hypothetical protein